MDAKLTPPHFLTKKCILGGTMLLFIFISLQIFLVTHAFTGSDHKKIVDFFTLVVFCTEVLVLYGLVHNNIYSAVVTSIGTAMLTVISAFEAYHQLLPWTIVLIILAITVCSFSFIYDLIIMRRAENANKAAADPANPYQRFNQNV